MIVLGYNTLTVILKKGWNEESSESLSQFRLANCRPIKGYFFPSESDTSMGMVHKRTR